MMAIEKSQKRTSNQDLEIAKVVETKKRKVEFAENLVTRYNSQEVVTNDDKISLQLFKGYVTDALNDSETLKDVTKLNSLVNQLSLPASSPDYISPENFNVLLGVLSNNINKIDNKRGVALIQRIINFQKWWALPKPTLTSYVYFLQILCSSIPKWWQDVSMALISNFKLPTTKTVKHHEMLKYFLRAIPSSTNFIDSYISKYFPNSNDSIKNLVNYISNILTLTEYCQELRFQAWSMVIEKIIAIDVELQNELDELDDEIEDDIDNELDDQDDLDSSDFSEDEVADEADEDLEGDEEYNVEISRNIKELSAKLDAILSLITTRLSDALTPDSIESGDGVSIFNTLISLFKSHILPTYYTRSVQYIMFHVSQQQTELMDAFLVTFIDIAFSPNEIMEKKIKALQYLGSFVARAKKLTDVQITFVASYLISWLNRYVTEREDEVELPGGMDRFKNFYAAFQSLCYIFCFRHALFRDSSSWECAIDKFFQRMVISKLNPLKYCNENVMMMFARIAQREDIVYCFSILENNSNERLRGIIGKANVGTKNNERTVSNWSIAARQQFVDLQSYFPFDPLFLKQYKKIMKDYYIEWSDISGEYESDESDEFDDPMA
ncbi:HBL026Wp [Eremothecium sinecaudum]|uniref:HBL026Wp n=1 Tax=Eremothecium sinecaudum TaxID=45286 RepID=A0A125RDX9_9SACH|nr:HBL026Wp [Eremothecium sinecaudum]AMD18876.1 HBL026Wp [Eremothecium sinecaudum]